MKKKLILSAFILIVVTLTVILLGQSNERVIYSSKINELPTTDALAMMYETESGSGEYIVSDDTSWPLEGYTFNAELSRCENGSKLYWDEETKSVMMEANVSDKCYVYFDVYEPPTLAKYIVSQYTTDGESGLYLHDGTGTYGAQEAGDNSYRYSGANPNNYVCFGSDAVTCPTDNLYRIIGVFGDQVKLIKTTSIGSYAWDADGDNTWDASTKPDIYTTLNATYYNTIGSKWQNLISETKWQVGGMDWGTTNIAKDYYNTEVGIGQSGYEENMKVGLIYVSDYGYGVSGNYWTTEIYNYESTVDSNWMYLGSTEWTISRTPSRSTAAFTVDNTGYAYDYDASFGYAVRPSFYLQPWVLYSSGDGTQENPYRIS